MQELVNAKIKAENSKKLLSEIAREENDIVAIINRGIQEAREILRLAISPKGKVSVAAMERNRLMLADIHRIIKVARAKLQKIDNEETGEKRLTRAEYNEFKLLEKFENLILNMDKKILVQQQAVS